MLMVVVDPITSVAIIIGVAAVGNVYIDLVQV
jgi:hypothetical protein